MLPDRTLRASDQEREQTASLLGDHLAAGRLDIPEFEERLAAAYEARTRGELDKLVVDLPAPADSSADGPVGEPGPPQVRDEEPGAHGTGHGFGPAMGHRLRLGGWLSTALICVAVWTVISVMAQEVLYFWPGWVIGPWGVMLLVSKLTNGQIGPGSGSGRGGH